MFQTVQNINGHDLRKRSMYNTRRSVELGSNESYSMTRLNSEDFSKFFVCLDIIF